MEYVLAIYSTYFMVFIHKYHSPTKKAYEFRGRISRIFFTSMTLKEMTKMGANVCQAENSTVVLRV